MKRSMMWLVLFAVSGALPSFITMKQFFAGIVIMSTTVGIVMLCSKSPIARELAYLAFAPIAIWIGHMILGLDAFPWQFYAWIAMIAVSVLGGVYILRAGSRCDRLIGVTSVVAGCFLLVWPLIGISGIVSIH